ncbi:major facilitator superfamily domain-containing protein [Neohortaea acidophila]|uniref:Major facilitator superfamily domain-containing protein n=1 Tax=Neohortaea acidophila TaxID=245834 RepID=A0A6A6PQC7_9PEZI|nr:major facilitator superfamily domain-containing protein [Neohortaea acidophila]KAF2482145.1 major facilitator superfamily domain-containing protein [Neohortaea acidophila]
MTPILAAGFNEVATQFDVPEPRVALTTGLYMLGLGIGSAILSPTAILYGKRPVYLCAAICFILTSVWCALSPDFPSLVIARVFMGIAVSSVECLPSATVAEIFFLHEKAYRLGIYTLLLLGGKNLVPLVSAVIIQSLDWRWVFWIVAMVVGLCFVLLFFFVPETFWDRAPRPRKHGLRRFSSLQGAFRRDSVPRSPDAAKKAEKSGQTDRDVSPIDLSPNDTTQNNEYFTEPPLTRDATSNGPSAMPELSAVVSDPEQQQLAPVPSLNPYTESRREQPELGFVQSLRPYAGRLTKDRWLRVAIRPFILYTYPSILWSALVYSLSVGWLIVLSESVSTIYEHRDTYNFNSLQTGLVYISPFVGGILGTVVAGKVSDRIVRFLSRRNGGVYEPEFRLVMGLPIAIFTTIGLMGYGWSAAERDLWIVPTVFFGFISFGCTLGSTTAITFAVDSYRQYAGEALVTLNFSKNIFHGLVFSLFFNRWLDADGSRTVFIALGGIQMACLLTTIPMYIYGKRARMWTVRCNRMERF